MDRDADGLRKLTRNYIREPRVTAQIRDLAGAPEWELRRRLEIRDHNHRDSVQPETLVYLLRERFAAEESDTAWRIAETLLQRIGGYVRRCLVYYAPLSREDRQDYDLDLQAHLLEEWRTLSGSGDFWEVHFWVCLKRAAIGIRKKRQRIDMAETEVAVPADGEDTGDPWDRIAHHQADIPRQVEARAALASIPDPYRQACYLHRVEQYTEPEIAEMMGKTDRTIRSYLRKAEDHLRQWLEK